MITYLIKQKAQLTNIASIFKLLFLVVLFCVLLPGLLCAEDYRLELIERHTVAELTKNSSQKAVYSKNYKSCLKLDRLEFDEAFLLGQLLDSTGSIIWSDTIGLDVYLGAQEDFFVTAYPLGGKKAEIYNISVSSTPINTIDFFPSVIEFTDDGAYVLIGGDEIALYDSIGHMNFHYKLRMTMHSKIAIGNEVKYIVVSDLLWSSLLNEHKHKKNRKPRKATNEAINPYKVPSHLRTREEIDAYVAKQKGIIEERHKKAIAKRNSVDSKKRPMTDGQLPQYISILTREGELVSEISIPKVPIRISLSYPNCEYIAVANYLNLHLYSLEGEVICTYTDNPDSFISTIAVSEQGFISAIINESQYRKNTNRRLIVIDFNGKLLAEYPLLNLKAIDGSSGPNLDIKGDYIYLSDKAEKSVFRIYRR